jgi:hypothetical protein
MKLGNEASRRWKVLLLFWLGGAQHTIQRLYSEVELEHHGSWVSWTGSGSLGPGTRRGLHRCLRSYSGQQQPGNLYRRGNPLALGRTTGRVQ